MAALRPPLAQRLEPHPLIRPVPGSFHAALVRETGEPSTVIQAKLLSLFGYLPVSVGSGS
jgi:hypothetical protein